MKNLFFLFSVLIVLTTQGASARYCADLSWQTTGPYPYLPPELGVTMTQQYLQFGCFEYAYTANVTFPKEEPIEWLQFTFPVSEDNTQQYFTDFTTVNPDHDSVSSQTRWFWDLARQVLTQENNYRRLYWQNATANEIASAVNEHSFLSARVLSPFSVDLKAVSVAANSYAYSGSPPSSTTEAFSSNEVATRIPSPTVDVDSFRPRSSSSSFFQFRQDFVTLARVFREPDFAAQVLESLQQKL